jgi:Mn2+/Fe2+ NRAMP family transporter
MKKIMEIALGIVTSVGGFLEIGSIATAAQAGADFSFQLIWAIVLGGLCIIFLVEQAGRFSAVSGRTIPDAIRERFGFNYFAFLYIVLALVSLLVLAAEIGGVCIALELATGIHFQWWTVPAAFLIWLVMWKGTFGVIEKGVSVLGLVTLSLVIGAYLIHPPEAQVLRGVLPSLPQHDKAHYWFAAVSILGASISPYLFFFYSSGAIEDEWNEGYVGVNRIIATGGMTFGSVISISVLILAAMIFAPQGVKFEHYSQLPDLLVPVFGYWGYWLLVASIGIACLGAALEITLEIAYLTAQGFGLELEREPATKRRSALRCRLHANNHCGGVDYDYGYRSVDAHDLLDGANGRDAACVDRAVSLPHERLQLRACVSQRLVFERGRDRDHQSRVRVGGGVDSFTDLRRR